MTMLELIGHDKTAPRPVVDRQPVNGGSCRGVGIGGGGSVMVAVVTGPAAGPAASLVEHAASDLERSSSLA